ncbi:hypothetical protein SFC73_18375 [Bacillus safensis]|uniref:hypothetical protein n=1 Tax=Bacillus safensis TaxID=561879 RepID=UPI003983A41D
MDPIVMLNLLAGYTKATIELADLLLNQDSASSDEEVNLILAGISSIVIQQNNFLQKRFEALQLQELHGDFYGLSVRLGEYKRNSTNSDRDTEQNWLVNIISDSADLYGKLYIKFSDTKDITSTIDILHLLLITIYLRIAAMIERKKTFGVNRDINIIDMITDVISIIDRTYWKLQLSFPIPINPHPPCSDVPLTLCLPTGDTNKEPNKEKEQCLNYLKNERESLIKVKTQFQRTM